MGRSSSCNDGPDDGEARGSESDRARDVKKRTEGEGKTTGMERREPLEAKRDGGGLSREPSEGIQAY